MANPNITKFAELAEADPALKLKIEAVYRSALLEEAEGFSALSKQAGAPFTAEDYLLHKESLQSELSAEELDQVAGGVQPCQPGQGNSSHTDQPFI